MRKKIKLQNKYKLSKILNFKQIVIKNNIETIKISLPDINEALRFDKSSEIKTKKVQGLIKNINFSYEKGDFAKLRIYLGELGDIISNLNVPQKELIFTKPKNTPGEIKSVTGNGGMMITDTDWFFKSNYGQVVIDVVREGERERSVTRIMDDLRGRLTDISGVNTLELVQLQNGPPTGKPVEVKINRQSALAGRQGDFLDEAPEDVVEKARAAGAVGDGGEFALGVAVGLGVELVVRVRDRTRIENAGAVGDGVRLAREAIEGVIGKRGHDAARVGLRGEIVDGVVGVAPHAHVGVLRAPLAAAQVELIGDERARRRYAVGIADIGAQ